MKRNRFNFPKNTLLKLSEMHDSMALGCACCISLTITAQTNKYTTEHERLHIAHVPP